jgi:hypothetical protein
MNAARLHHGIACLTDGSIVVVGGTTDLTNPLSSAERYSGGAWVHLLSIGEARMFPTVMPLSDARAIYIGGTTDAAGLITSAVSNDVSIYSVANNTWTAQTSLITSRRQFKAVQITGAIMVINGITGNGDIGKCVVAWCNVVLTDETDALFRSSEQHGVCVCQLSVMLSDENPVFSTLCSVQVNSTEFVCAS